MVGTVWQANRKQRFRLSLDRTRLSFRVVKAHISKSGVEGPLRSLAVIRKVKNRPRYEMQRLQWRDDTKGSLAAFHRRRLDECLGFHSVFLSILLGARHYSPTYRNISHGVGDFWEGILVQEL